MRTGLALAGGGPVGAVYEVAVLCALQDALDGVDFTAFDIYVGVSSGAFIASLLANGFTPVDLREILVETSSLEHAVNPEVFLSPAVRELAQRTGALPRLALETLWARAREAVGGRSAGPSGGIGGAIPIGLFDNERMAAFLEEAFRGHGRSNDFRELKHELRVIATDLDTSEATEFGAPGLDRVPISRAVQASSALPLLYPPVEIGGRHYVDGALRKTLHASVALREGARLLICVNPIIPFDASLAAGEGRSHGRLIDRGLPAVLSQSFRTLIYSRMEAAMERYARQYPDAAVLLFEPKRNEGEMFFTNVFNDADRHEVFERAYRATLRDLAARRQELVPKLRRHGIAIRPEVLRSATPGAARHRPVAARSLSRTLDRLERWMDRK